ncbi:hypothetical protein Ahy_A09g045998 [Arachis hypogaea]|uniref:Uncharacterized protein n=1 Tax=Arachis hypogaea TaxID=3818 RepID=A0A445BNP4_ARAHY|nr:hypothetical protein Ahy_A09g045998 [Arachis hypogaea]
MGNNDINVIQYYDQRRNSSNNIYHLDLSNNDNFKADNIFHWISNLSSLEYLDLILYLSANRFIPAKLSNWIFNLNSSIPAILFFKSLLPTGFKNLSSLTSILFYIIIINSINGSISNVLLNSKILMLDGNNLRDNTPRILPNGTLLNLSNSSLSGSIFHFLCYKIKKINLKYSDLAHNLLSGKIANFYDQVHFLVLHNNSINVYSIINYLKYSLSLRNCEIFHVLNLNKNEFSIAISNRLGQNIIVFQLRSNLFSANIPTIIYKLNILKILYLSNNKLSGSISSYCYNMTSMIFKNKSFDSFGVIIPMIFHSNYYYYVKLRTIPKFFFVMKRTRAYCSHLNMESLILLPYFFHSPLREKIVANEKEFIMITSPTKSKSSIFIVQQFFSNYDNFDKLRYLTSELNLSSLFDLQFLSYLDLDNNDINIIQYYDQRRNSSNNIYHLDLQNFIRDLTSKIPKFELYEKFKPM